MILWLFAAFLIVVIVCIRPKQEPLLSAKIPAPFGYCDEKADTAKLDKDGTNCNRKFSGQYIGTEIEKNDILNVPVENEQGCQYACNSTANCMGYTYIWEDKTCYLKNSTSPLNALNKSKVGGVAGSSAFAAPFGLCNDFYGVGTGGSIKLDAKGTNCPKTFEYDPGKNYPGNDLYNTVADNILKCESLCKSSKPCQGFTYRQSDNKCFLKHKMGEKKVDPSVDSGVAQNFGMCEDGKHAKTDEKGTNCSITFERDEKMSHIGNTLLTVSGGVDISACEDLCINTPGCKGYDYEQAKWACTLKSSMKNGKENPTFKSGTVQNLGFCYEDDQTIVKLDEAGSNCFGVCENDPRIKKLDSIGSNCFGKCEYGMTDQYKLDKAGTNCTVIPTPFVGKDFPDNNIDVLRTDNIEKDKAKLDKMFKDCVTSTRCKGIVQNYKKGEYSTKSDMSNGVVAEGVMSVKLDNFGVCKDGKTVKTDAKGMNCFGPCPNKPTVAKENDAGTNCFGPCPTDVGGFKLSAQDTCYGACPGDMKGFKQSKEDTCFGVCEDGRFKKSKTDDCETIKGNTIKEKSNGVTANQKPVSTNQSSGVKGTTSYLNQ